MIAHPLRSEIGCLHVAARFDGKQTRLRLVGLEVSRIAAHHRTVLFLGHFILADPERLRERDEDGFVFFAPVILARGDQNHFDLHLAGRVQCKYFFVARFAQVLRPGTLRRDDGLGVGAVRHRAVESRGLLGRRCRRDDKQ